MVDKSQRAECVHEETQRAILKSKELLERIRQSIEKDQEKLTFFHQHLSEIREVIHSYPNNR